jgi:hypothetical protein
MAVEEGQSVKMTEKPAISSIDSSHAILDTPDPD